MKMVVRDKHDGAHGQMEVRLWLRLLTCSTIIEKRLRRRFAEQYDTTLPRFDVLAALDRHREGLTMGALSRALLTSNGNSTALVRQLEAQGLITMEVAPDDRRSSIVKLTKQGAEHFAVLAAAHRQWIGAMLAKVPEAQQEALFGLLATVKASIAEEQSPGDGA